MQVEFLREEARIGATLEDIQGMNLSNMDALHKHISYAKTLIHHNNFSIDDHMMELLVEVHIALHASHVLQENWDKKVSLILKVHSVTF